MFNKSTFFVAAMALAQLAAAGLNAFIEPETGRTLEAGKPFDILWKPDGGKTISFDLRKGDSKNLDDVGYLFPNIPNTGKFTWWVMKDLVAGDDYALQIRDDETGEINYTGLFTIKSDAKPSDKPKSTTSSSSSAPTTITSVIAGKNGTMTTTTIVSKPSPTNNSTTTAKPSPVNESGAESLVRSPIALFFAVAGAALYLQ
jgi:hypothetical protein